MHTTVKSCLVALTILLSGCDNDFAALEFGQSVTTERSVYNGSGNTIKPVYRDHLDALLRAEGIDPELVDMRADQASRGLSVVLSTPIFGGISAEQQGTIKQALQNIIVGRTTPLGVHLTLRPNDMQTESAKYRQDAAALAQEYTTNLQVKDVQIGVSYGIADMLNSVMAGSKENKGEAFCSVSMTVDPQLPFIDLKVITSADGQPTHALVKNYKNAYTRYSIPVDIVIAQPDLQAKLASHEIQMSTDITHSSAGHLNRKGTKELELQLGTLGEITHEHTKVGYLTHGKLEEKCRQMAAAAGRPFSYHMGDSLDRLTAVSFY